MHQLHCLNTQLFDLKMAFDNAIENGNSLAEVKKIYKQIKEVERLIIERQVELLKADKDVDEDELL